MATGQRVSIGGRIRVSWLVVLAVVLAMAAVPTWRTQVRLAWGTLGPAPQGPGARPSADLEQPEWYVRVLNQLQPYQAQAVAFAEERFPGDARMLTAAGLLGGDRVVLQRAAEMGDDPVCWAAYAESLLARGRGFDRVECSGVDPEDAAGMFDERQRISQSGLPAMLSEEEAAPVLEALRRWQRSDPENGLPVGLETLWLYGLHRDEDASATWARAGRMPVVTGHAIGRVDAIRRLLVAMGMPEAEAIIGAWSIITFPSLAHIRQCARLSVHEGRLAQMEGRSADAVTWWQSTVAFGQHTEDSAETLIEWLVGAAILGIGASPVWQWHHDGRSGVPNGPLFGGRIFYGPQHAFYVTEMGSEADEHLRDAIVRAKVRSALTRRHGAFDISEDFGLAVRYLRFAGTLMIAIPGLFFVFAALGTWSRREADEAVQMRPLWGPLLIALSVLPVVAGALVVPLLRERPPIRWPEFHSIIPAGNLDLNPIFFLGPPILSVLAAVFLTSLAADIGRASGSSAFAAWRGYIRRVFPMVIACFALIFLVLSATAENTRAAWVGQATAPGGSPVSLMIDRLGEEWTSPTIPPDAWRVEYPPGP